VDGGAGRRTSARRSAFGDETSTRSDGAAAAVGDRPEVGASARATLAAAPAKERARRWANARTCLLVALIALLGALVWRQADRWMHHTQSVTLEWDCGLHWTDDRTGITWSSGVLGEAPPPDIPAESEPPRDGSEPAAAPRGPRVPGTMSIVDAGHAQFTSDAGEVVALTPLPGEWRPVCWA
jgi:hypothetical protein